NDKWTKLQDGLDDYLQALVQLNFKMVLMNNAKRFYLPKKLSLDRGNSRDCLYNDIIDLLKEKEYSASEIWASGSCWSEIIPEVFNLALMMRKYTEHLQKSSQLTNNAHYSTELVHIPSKHCKLKTIL
ncbi:22767_t:CDS:2, partial [Racocetra persica]